VAHCLKNISWQLMLAGQVLKFGKFIFQPADLRPALYDETHQSPNQKIAFRSKPFHLAFIGYSLIAEDLEDLPDFL
jgi:hypothetical protein